MTASLKSIEGTGDIASVMREIGLRARAASRALAGMTAAVRKQASAILSANAEDVAEAKAAGVTGAFFDRLALDATRVEAIAAGIDAVRGLKDPVGTVLDSWTRPNGMRIERVR